MSKFENYSVLMSVYKNEKSGILRESMQSIYDQTVPTDDFVLVCDGPLTKRLDGVIDEMQEKFGKRLRVIRLEENHGAGYARNIGMQKCKNDLVAIMDSDDVSIEDRCEKELSIFQEKPGLSVVGGFVGEFVTTINEVESIRRVPEENDEIMRFAKWRSPINQPSAMLRKRDVMSVGNYPVVRYCEDYLLWINLLSKGYKFYNLQEILTYMREDRETFRRRGGWRYFMIQKDLFKIMRKKRFLSAPEYMAVMAIRFSSALVPNWLRQSLFERFMREKIK